MAEEVCLNSHFAKNAKNKHISQAVIQQQTDYRLLLCQIVKKTLYIISGSWYWVTIDSQKDSVDCSTQNNARRYLTC